MFDLVVVDASILSGGLPCMRIEISFADHPYGIFVPFFNCIVFYLVLCYHWPLNCNR